MTGHVFLSSDLPSRPTIKQPVTTRRATKRKNVPPTPATDYNPLLLKLTEISEQMGASAASIEAIREDIRDANADSKAYRLDISARLDNITVRLSKVEKQAEETKTKVDELIMPLVEATNDRKLQIKGALRVWGVVIMAAGGLSAVFWQKFSEFIAWIVSSGSTPS